MTMTGENVSYCHTVHLICNIAWLAIESEPPPFGFISIARFVCLFVAALYSDNGPRCL